MAEAAAATARPTDGWHLAALVIVGWPGGHHGPLRRKPVSQVAAFDHWDRPFAT